MAGLLDSERGGGGRALAAGTRLALNDADAWGSDRVLTQPPAVDERPIRLVPGPQADHFSAAALEALVGGDYRVTAEADRMGIRLEGARLEHTAAAEERGWKVSEEKTAWYIDQLKTNKMTVQPAPEALQAELLKVGEKMTAEWVEKAGPEGQAILDAYRKLK